MSTAMDEGELRAMALHRGLKLVKSRRRKPGSGDYGKYGLEDGAGKPLLGFGPDGLTASADDIEAHLRGGVRETWKQSAVKTPARVKAKIESSIDVAKPPPNRAAPARKANHSHSDVVQHVPDIPAAKKPKAEQTSQILSIGAAKPAHAPLVANLLGLGVGKVSERLTQMRAMGGGAAIAQLGVVVGCCSWVVVPTIRHGLVGRITLLYVAEDHRRKGIGTALLAEAEKELLQKGCALLEVMSDIEIKNAHNFFRTLKFEQTSYRFARTIPSR